MGKDYLVRKSKDSREGVGSVIKRFPVSPWPFVKIRLAGDMTAIQTATAIA